jgi:hypothetical protein
VKLLPGLLLLAIFLPMRQSTLSTTDSSESFRVVAIPMRDTGYSNFDSVAFTSRADFDAFIKRSTTQLGWNNRKEFEEAIGNAKVDFTREALVLLRHTESSGSVQVAFETPIVKDRKLVCQILGRAIPSGYGGTSDMAYYCFAVVVSKSAVAEVELRAVEGGFQERRLAPIVFKIAAQ